MFLRSGRLVHKVGSGGYVLLNSKGLLYELSAVAIAIWQRLDGATAIEQIEPHESRATVKRVIKKLEEVGLVQVVVSEIHV